MTTSVENADKPLRTRIKFSLDSLAQAAYSAGVAKKRLTREEVIAMLRKEQNGRSLREFAKALGVSGAYLSDIYLGRRDPGPAVLETFGLQRHETVEYQHAE